MSFFMKKIKHEMVRAIGEKEFKKILDDLPLYYSDEYKDNFKPIGIQIIWEIGDVGAKKFSNIEKGIELAKMAQKLWKSGISRIDAARKALELAAVRER